MFNTIAAKGVTIVNLSDQLKMSRKQYYLRISKLVETGMIIRKEGKYTLTSFGKVIHEVELILMEVVRSHWKSKAVDCLGSMNEITVNQCKQVLVDHLIENAGMMPVTSALVSSKVVK